jgi:hypothetical protein
MANDYEGAGRMSQHSPSDRPVEIAARMDGPKAHCRRCGQFLWRVENGQLSSRFGSVEGKRPVAGVWELTRQARQERRAALAAQRDPALSPEERQEARDRVRHNRWSGGRAATDAPLSAVESVDGARRAMQTAAISTLPADLAAALRLPAKVKCPNCPPERPVINLIDLV